MNAMHTYISSLFMTSNAEMLQLPLQRWDQEVQRRCALQQQMMEDSAAWVGLWDAGRI
jgi:hypothetical protein